MHQFQGHASVRVDASAQAVFDFITDLARLPEWNVAIEVVADWSPALAEGIEWTVKTHPPHTPSWRSISPGRGTRP